ncbi:MAG: hypothetical protein HWE25_02415, partial [Alphaproteobacteria bacterium]|nr:hypothetical protein [Alphaproteobacteria bacterium]
MATKFNNDRRGARSKYLGSAATALALIAMGTGAANAQDADAEEELNLEEIVVTGSLIKNPNL